jgi:hypothetical protein
MAPDELPEDLTFEDFLQALDEVDRPVDADLPTDWDGCVEVVTVAVGEVGRMTERLHDAGIEPHVELPEDDEVREGGATASLFVPSDLLARARAVLGIAT